MAFWIPERVPMSVLALAVSFVLLALLTVSCSGGGEPGGGTAGDGSSSGAGAEIETNEVSYEADGVTMKGFVAWPKGAEKRPGVLVVHEWWGHNEYCRDRARQLARMGYPALAVDMYGDGKNTGHPKDAGEFMKALMGDQEKVRDRFRAALDVLRQHEATDPEKMAAIGYCMGGSIVLGMARSGADLDAVAAFHASLGGLPPLQEDEVEAKILVCHGAEDEFTPDDVVASFKEEMEALGDRFEFHSYEGAKHGFTNPGATEKGKEFDLPLAYDEAADEKSWAELKKLLDTL